MEPLFEIAGADVTALELVIGLLLLCAGVLLSLLFRRRDTGLHAELMAMRGQQAELQGRLAQLAEEQAQRGDLFQTSLDNRLSDLTDRMGRNLADSSERSAQHLKSLHTRLEVIDRAQRNIEALAGEVSGLQSILSNKQARGAFGEKQMQSLIEQFLPARSYGFQSTLSNGTRVDALIHLPGDHLDVAVDSKFPLEAWQRLMDAEAAGADTTMAMRQFKADCLRHVRDIADKYLLPGETHEVALMFLPSEAIYAELHARYADVIDRSFQARVMIVSPTTFMATLHTMNAVLKDANMRENVHLILAEVGTLQTDVARLEERVGRMSSQYKTLGKTLDEVEISTGKIGKRSARIESMELGDEPGEMLPPAANEARLL